MKSYMEDLVYIVLSLVLGLFFATKALKSFLTPQTDLYSDYRNKYDYGERLFIRMLFFNRFVYTLLAAVLLSFTVYEIFFK